MIRLGFLGCDARASVHLRTLATLDDAQPCAFFDGEFGRAQKLAKAHGGRAYKTVAELLAAGTPDALFVGANCDLETALLGAKAGSALWLEPSRPKSRKALDAFALGVANAKVLAVWGFAWRYADSLARLQKMLAVKNVAPLQTLELRGSRDEAFALLDLARALNGEVARVTSANNGENVCALLEFASGAIGTSSFAPSTFDEPSLRSRSRDALYEWTSHALTVRQDGETHIFAGDDGLLEAQRAFLASVKTGKRAGLKNGFADGLLTLSLALATETSARTRKAVTPT